MIAQTNVGQVGTKNIAQLQMLDKVWFDWQHRDPKNANSFFGGSVQALQSLDIYRKYPVGGPPYLSVSADYTKIETLVLICLHS